MDTVTLTLTSQNAEMVGFNLSRRLSTDFYVVSYNDPENGRVVLHIYPNNAENCGRIARQIKRYRAAVFSRGERMDDSVFGGA